MFAELRHTLGNYLAFSRETWLTIVSEFNEQWLPVQIVGFVLGMVLLWFLLRQSDRQPVIQRIMLVVIGASWLFVGIAFHLGVLRQIDWSASWSGWAFVLQGVLMLAAACVVRVPTDLSSVFRFRLASGFGAALGFPLLQLSSGYSLNQLETFGTSGSEACLMTAAIIPGLSRRWAWLLLIPWLWSLRQFTIAWPLGDWPGMLLLPWMTVAVVLALVWRRQ